ncbi:MAG: GNAT family N-acetyltransferase, partial [Terriglobales bacterium]
VGGTDPDNLTLGIIRALQLLAEDNLEATIVVGGSNPHSDGLEKEIRSGGGALRLLRDAFDMSTLMADADVAISAAGITCWEMCFLGLPALLIDVAENQTPVAHELDRQGVAIYAGSSRQVTPEDIAARLKLLLAAPERRAALSEGGRKLVDGCGAERVVSAMQPLTLQLRRAERKDCRLLWEWANDPAARAAAFSTGTIPWELHQAWFEDKMKDPNCLLLIGENSEGRPVGQIRLDLRSGGEGEIDVSVSPDARGSGWGSRLIDLGVREAFARTDAECLHAFIRRENEMSVRAFERAHFLKQGEDVVKLQPALHYCRSKNSRPI